MTLPQNSEPMPEILLPSIHMGSLIQISQILGSRPGQSQSGHAPPFLKSPTIWLLHVCNTMLQIWCVSKVCLLVSWSIGLLRGYYIWSKTGWSTGVKHQNANCAFPSANKLLRSIDASQVQLVKQRSVHAGPSQNATFIGLAYTSQRDQSVALSSPSCPRQQTKKKKNVRKTSTRCRPNTPPSPTATSQHARHCICRPLLASKGQQEQSCPAKHGAVVICDLCDDK